MWHSAVTHPSHRNAVSPKCPLIARILARCHFFLGQKKISALLYSSNILQCSMDIKYSAHWRKKNCYWLGNFFGNLNKFVSDSIETDSHRFQVITLTFPHPSCQRSIYWQSKMVSVQITDWLLAPFFALLPTQAGTTQTFMFKNAIFHSLAFRILLHCPSRDSHRSVLSSVYTGCRKKKNVTPVSALACPSRIERNIVTVFKTALFHIIEFLVSKCWYIIST